MRSQFQYWGPYLAARRYGLLAISYRLAKKGTKAFPEAVHDVVAAVRFLRAKAAEFRLDPERLGLFGASAGAHLAALAALGANADVFMHGYPDDSYAKLSAKVKIDPATIAGNTSGNATVLIVRQVDAPRS